MSLKTMGLYGGVFVGMLIFALLITGTFQQGILPRLSGQAASESATEGTPGSSTAAGPKAPAPSKEAQNPEPPVRPGVVADAPPTPPAGSGEVAPPLRRESGAGIDAGKEVQAKRLARIYEGMRPKEAAAVLEKIERPLATQLLQGIKERQTAKILAAMNPGVAAELTRLLGQAGESVAP